MLEREARYAMAPILQEEEDDKAELRLVVVVGQEEEEGLGVMLVVGIKFCFRDAAQVYITRQATKGTAISL